MQAGQVGLPGQHWGGCLHAGLFQNKVSLGYLQPQHPHPQGILNTIGRFSANMGWVSSEDMMRIGSGHMVH